MTELKVCNVFKVSIAINAGGINLSICPTKNITGLHPINEMRFIIIEGNFSVWCNFFVVIRLI